VAQKSHRIKRPDAGDKPGRAQRPEDMRLMNPPLGWLPALTIIAKNNSSPGLKHVLQCGGS
jgi:hypothetical protein